VVIIPNTNKNFIQKVIVIGEIVYTIWYCMPYIYEYDMNVPPSYNNTDRRYMRYLSGLITYNHAQNYSSDNSALNFMWINSTQYHGNDNSNWAAEAWDGVSGVSHFWRNLYHYMVLCRIWLPT